MLASQLGRLKLAIRSRRFWMYVVVTIAGIGVGVGIALAGGRGSKKPSSPATESAAYFISGTMAQ